MKQVAATLAAAVTVLAVYVAVLAAMPKGAFWSPDEGAKYLQLRSIGWSGGGLTYAIPYAGAAIDPDFAFYPTRCRYEDLYPVRLPDGAVKFHWPIWFSLITHPLVALFGLSGLYVVPLVSGWLVALLSGLLARRYDPRLAPLAILAVGLATPIAFFSLTHWEHTLATLLALSALALAAADRSAPRRIPPGLAAPLMLAAVVLRIELLPFAVAVGVAVALAQRAGSNAVPVPRPARRRPLRLVLAVLVAAMLAVVVPMALPARHLWLLQALPEYARGNLSKLPHLLQVLTSVFVEATGNQAPRVSAPLRVVGLVAFAVAAAAPFLPGRRLAAGVALAGLFAALDFSLYVAILPQPYLTMHGLLPVSPFIVLAAYAVADGWRERRFDRLVLTTTAWLYLLFAFAVIFTFTVEPNGRYRTGLEWGNRYLLTLYPLATVLALAGLQALRRNADGRVLRGALTAIGGGLLVCGLQMQVRGLMVLVASRELVTTWQRALEGPVPVVTDVWWLPASMAPFFSAHPMHCVLRPDELAAWYPSALAHGVDGFVFASFHEFDAARFASGDVRVEDARHELVSGLHVTRFRLAPPRAGDGAHG